MKRVIQCPKCQAKLAVFDIGKPINQKCPKCGNAFVVESEEAKPGDAAKTAVPAVTAAVAEKSDSAQTNAKTGTQTDAQGAEKAEAKPDVKPEPKDESQPKTQAESKPHAKTDVKEELKTTPKADVKESLIAKPTPKPALPKPAAAPVPAPEFAEHHGGTSIMPILVIIALLIFVIVMQVRAWKNSENRFNGLETQISAMHKALSSQIIKNR